MKRALKIVSSCLFALMAFVYLSIPAFAKDAAVSYDGSAQKFIFAPGSEDSPTDLFDNFKGVMPGDSLTQKIVVKNDVSNKVKVKIYLRSLGAQEGSEEFLSQMNLTVTQNGDSELFAAPANQTDGLADWVCLGTFYSGADIDLNVVLDVPNTMGNEFQDAVGSLEWQFKAEELPINPDDPQPPKTGEDTSIWLYIGVCFVSAGAILILFMAERKNNGSKRD